MASQHPLPVLLHLLLAFLLLLHQQSSASPLAAEVRSAGTCPFRREPARPLPAHLSAGSSPQCKATEGIAESRRPEPHVSLQDASVAHQRSCPEIEEILRHTDKDNATPSTTGLFTRHPPAQTPHCDWQVRLRSGDKAALHQDRNLSATASVSIAVQMRLGTAHFDLTQLGMRTHSCIVVQIRMHQWAESQSSIADHCAKRTDCKHLLLITLSPTWTWLAL